MQYTVLYAVTLSICIILLVSLYWLNYKNRNLVFRSSLSVVYFSTILTAVLDIIWVFIDYTPSHIILNYIINCVYLPLMPIIGYCWFMYCNRSFDLRFLKKRWAKFLFALPVLFVYALSISSIFTGWLFFITENGQYIRGPFYFIIAVIAYSYIISASIISLIYRNKVQLYSMRRFFLNLAIFPVFPMIMAGIQLMVPPGLPLTQFGTLLALFIYYEVSQEQKIIRDSLTKLQNRYSLDLDLIEKVGRHEHDTLYNLYIVIGDLDDFKKINDTYGHLEGDAALIKVAKLFLEETDKLNASAYRMGGDEFVALIETNDEAIVHCFMNDINAKLESTKNETPYGIHISFGCARLCPEMSPADFIKSADKILYERKRENKSK